jgi:hypothetical protein
MQRAHVCCLTVLLGTSPHICTLGQTHTRPHICSRPSHQGLGHRRRNHEEGRAVQAGAWLCAPTFSAPPQTPKPPEKHIRSLQLLPHAHPAAAAAAAAAPTVLDWHRLAACRSAGLTMHMALPAPRPPSHLMPPLSLRSSCCHGRVSRTSLVRVIYQAHDAHRLCVSVGWGAGYDAR